MKFNPLIIICALVITLLFFSLVFAESVDWSNPAATDNYEQNFVKDPVGGFQADPDKAWGVLSKRPDLLSRTEVLDAAFENNYQQAATIINQHTELLSDANILSKFDQKIRGVGTEGVTLLNNNPSAKKAWLYKRYKVDMEISETVFADLKVKKVELKFGKWGEYLIITTSGSGATTFNAEDYPKGGAKILQDGSLQLLEDGMPKGIVKGCTDFSLKRGENGLPVSSGGSVVFLMHGGELIVNPDSKGVFNLEVKRGKMIVRSSTAGYGDVVYHGDFSVSRIDQEISVSGRFTRFYSVYNQYLGPGTKGVQREIIPMGVLVNGKITSNIKDVPSQFIIDGPAELKFLSSDSEDKGFNGNVLKIEGNSKVYYSETKISYSLDDGGNKIKLDPADFCENGYVCILNTPSERYNSAYRERFAVYNGQHGDKITYFSPNYYSNVEISNLKDGEINFVSTKLVNPKTGQGEVAAMITAHPYSGIEIAGGNMNEMKAGRIDVFYNKDKNCQKDCEVMLNHWSGLKGMKSEPQKYFQRIYESNQRKDASSIVTCSLKIGDCEEKFAQSYGKIVAPGGKKPQTTVIVAGDYVNMAQSQETGWCTDPAKGGCYILDSRNIPPTTNSINLVITGHHWYDEEYFWRDSPEITNPNLETHNPIDRTYVSCTKYSHTGCLPEGSSVLRLGFSACNTNIPPKLNAEGELVFDYFINGLFKKYPRVEKDSEGMITGWNGIAPTAESSPGPVVPLQFLNQYQLRNGNKGSRASLVKLPTMDRNTRRLIGFKWYWSTEGKTYCALTNAGDFYCNPFAVVGASN